MGMEIEEIEIYIISIYRSWFVARRKLKLKPKKKPLVFR
jgi:hypothetical protein